MRQTGADRLTQIRRVSFAKPDNWKTFPLLRTTFTRYEEQSTRNRLENR